MSSSKIRLDEIDRKILDILQANARITNAQLSKDIGLSPAPTLERVKKLETTGIINSYHALLNAEKVNLDVNTFVQVTLKSHNKKTIDLFVSAINEIPEIIECHHTTGAGDFILRVIAQDIQSYQKLILEKVSEIEVVSGLHSFVILSTFKNSKVMPIPD